MKLYYFRRDDGIGNFGDDLNPWLWRRLLADVLDDDDQVAFVGIGTLLNDQLADRCGHPRLHVVFGSGVGYEGQLHLNPIHRYRIYALRGPVSAAMLGVSPDLAVVDPGLLLRRFASSSVSAVRHAAFMPHVEQAIVNAEVWKQACAAADITFIDPRDPVDTVLASLAQHQLLLSEAMHGAIAAEALEIPWIPLRMSEGILEMKWRDWCESLQLSYSPVSLDLSDFHPLNHRELPPTLEQVSPWAIERLARQLAHLAGMHEPVQGASSHTNLLLERLEERLDRMRSDVASGGL